MVVLWMGLQMPSLIMAVESEDDIFRQEAKSLYNQVPNVEISLTEGRQIRLSELWRDKPVLVTLFYNRCTGSCSPFLRSLKEAVEEVGGLGDDYRIVSLSFDPKDTLEDVSTLASTLEIQQKSKWLIGTAAPGDITQIADAIGFWYKRQPATDQFDHPSLIAAVRDGKVVRVLLGSMVEPSRLKELIFELQGIFVPFYSRPGENILFRCLQVDESSQSVRFSWGMLLLFFPGLLALVVTWVLFRRKNYS